MWPTDIEHSPQSSPLPFQACLLLPSFCNLAATLSFCRFFFGQQTQARCVAVRFRSAKGSCNRAGRPGKGTPGSIRPHTSKNIVTKKKKCRNVKREADTGSDWIKEEARGVSSADYALGCCRAGATNTRHASWHVSTATNREQTRSARSDRPRTPFQSSIKCRSTFQGCRFEISDSKSGVSNQWF